MDNFDFHHPSWSPSWPPSFHRSGISSPSSPSRPFRGGLSPQLPSLQCPEYQILFPFFLIVISWVSNIFPPCDILDTLFDVVSYHLWSNDATVRAKGICIGVVDKLIAGLGGKSVSKTRNDTKVQLVNLKTQKIIIDDYDKS